MVIQNYIIIGSYSFRCTRLFSLSMYKEILKMHSHLCPYILVLFFAGLWRDTSPRHRKGILWIYGDSNAGRFYRSIRKTPLCKTVFKGCTFSYNWIYPIKNATVEMNQRNFLPINITRVLEAIANVIHSPHMNDKNSVILLNHGLHFITSTNFSTYRVVIDRIVDLFKGTKKNDQGEEELKFKGKMIWKTNAAIHRERLRLPHHHKRRFLTRQVLLTFVHHFKIGTIRAFH